MSRWEDLALGFRLAVGGGRSSVVRLVLATIGIGLAVAVLLLAASAGNAYESRQQRENASRLNFEAAPGVAPLHFTGRTTEFRGEPIRIDYVHATGPDSPVPPGLDRVPSPGEVVVSPRLNELLSSDAGALLRPRFPGTQIGVIDSGAVQNPRDLSAYIGVDASLTGAPIYGFGSSSPREPLPPAVLLVLMIGVVALLTPVFIFIGTVSRIGGAERDRRLAALRLAGASSWQVRRVATAETLVSSVTGMLAGAGLFLLFRGQIADLQVFRFGLFPSDLTPSWPLVVLIVLLVPALTMAATLVAQRRTIIEPLGVVREAAPIRRRLWWRLLLVVAGIALLVPGYAVGSELARTAVMVGALLLLIGIPAMLPWLLDRAVSRIRGGPPAFQLAIRRLQSDSGTPSRVVAGLCVVIAGAIALQSLLAGQAAFYQELPTTRQQSSSGSIEFTAWSGEAAENAVPAVRALPGVAEVRSVRTMFIDGSGGHLGVADCLTIKAVTTATSCADGDVFSYREERGPSLHKGQSVNLADTGRREQRWTVPADPRPVDFTKGEVAFYSDARILATPGAMVGVELAGAGAAATARPTVADPDFVEQVRNAVAPFGWQTQVSTIDGKKLTDESRMFADVRDILFGCALFILLLAGVSLLVLAQEQVRERRRAIGALSATGVPVRVVMRSLVWQNGIPLLLGVGVAIATGIAITAKATRMLSEPLVIDWSGVGVLAGAALLVVLLVTASTFPSVRSAARSENLRTE
ncbi:FtsX-like permease family protein [Amycolatopsis pittospori]|uniref:FtsX-like permease family protein n=1 Tax=Amycolatopsis pittospori TaxID=2749434 RepID=UPI0015F07EB4|nr:FtsX-like permease family protein [Amycolatopsis pittospori]